MKDTITVQLSEDLKTKAKLKSSCTSKDISEVVRKSLEDWTEDVNIIRDSKGDVEGIKIEGLQ